MFLRAADDLAGAIVVDAKRTEHRFGIARAKRREALEVVIEFLGYVLEVDDRVDSEVSLGLLGLDMLLDIFLETLAKRGDVGPAQSKSGSIGVPSEIDEQVTAALNGRIDVEAHHRTCRACRKVAVTRKNNCWPEIDLSQSGSHNADDAFLPVLVIEDDA